MPKVAQALARHSDINLTLGVYTHLEMDELHEGIGRLDRIVVSGGQEGKGEKASPEKESSEGLTEVSGS